MTDFKISESFLCQNNKILNDCFKNATSTMHNTLRGQPAVPKDRCH